MSEDNLVELRKHLDNIKSQIDIGNELFQNDKVAYNTQRIILASILDTIPTALQKFTEMPKQSTANALTTLVSKVGDLFAEIRQTQDLTNQVEYLVSEIIDPILKKTITSMYDEMFFIKSSLKSSTNDKELLNKVDLLFDEYLKKVSASMVDIKADAEKRIRSYMLEI